jgi:hypothetical protein
VAKQEESNLAQSLENHPINRYRYSKGDITKDQVSNSHFIEDLKRYKHRNRLYGLTKRPSVPKRKVNSNKSQVTLRTVQARRSANTGYFLAKREEVTIRTNATIDQAKRNSEDIR